MLFFPDQHLGRNTGFDMGYGEADMRVWNPRFELGGLEERDVKEATLLLWKGHCSVHQRFRPEHVAAFREEHPDGLVIVHPECAHDVVELADRVGSTERILDWVENAPAGTVFGVGTEIHMVQRMAAEHPDVTVTSLDPLICPCSTMFRIDGPHLAWVLESLVRGDVVNQITVDAADDRSGPASHSSACSTSPDSRQHVDRRLAEPTALGTTEREQREHVEQRNVVDVARGPVATKHATNPPSDPLRRKNRRCPPRAGAGRHALIELQPLSLRHLDDAAREEVAEVVDIFPRRHPTTCAHPVRGIRVGGGHDKGAVFLQQSRRELHHGRRALQVFDHLSHHNDVEATAGTKLLDFARVVDVNSRDCEAPASQRLDARTMDIDSEALASRCCYHAMQEARFYCRVGEVVHTTDVQHSPATNHRPDELETILRRQDLDRNQSSSPFVERGGTVRVHRDVGPLHRVKFGSAHGRSNS